MLPLLCFCHQIFFSSYFQVWFVCSFFSSRHSWRATHLLSALVCPAWCTERSPFQSVFVVSCWPWGETISILFISGAAFRPPSQHYIHTYTNWKVTDKMFAAESHLMPHCRHKHMHMTNTYTHTNTQGSNANPRQYWFVFWLEPHYHWPLVIAALRGSHRDTTRWNLPQYEEWQRHDTIRKTAEPKMSDR